MALTGTWELPVEHSARAWSASIPRVAGSNPAGGVTRETAMGPARRFVAAKLDRLSRSVVEFWAACREGFQARLVASSPSMPMLTTTAAGEFMASVLVSAAQYERQPIAQRTPAATDSGPHVATRWTAADAREPKVRERIRRERQSGRSLRSIASGPNADGTPTAPRGARYALDRASCASVLRTRRRPRPDDLRVTHGRGLRRAHRPPDDPRRGNLPAGVRLHRGEGRRVRLDHVRAAPARQRSPNGSPAVPTSPTGCGAPPAGGK